MSWFPFDARFGASRFLALMVSRELPELPKAADVEANTKLVQAFWDDLALPRAVLDEKRNARQAREEEDELSREVVARALTAAGLSAQRAKAATTPKPKPAGRRPPIRLVTFEEAIRQAYGFVQAAVWQADDREVAGPAFRAICVALRGLRGERGMALDALAELGAVLRGRAPPPNRDAKLRRIVELIDVRVEPWVRQYGRSIVAQEAAALCRELKRAFPKDFRTLTPIHCHEALRRWSPKKPTKGQLSTNGIAVELLACSGASKPTKTTRGRLRKEVNQAVGRAKVRSARPTVRGREEGRGPGNAGVPPPRGTSNGPNVGGEGVPSLSEAKDQEGWSASKRLAASAHADTTSGGQGRKGRGAPRASRRASRSPPGSRALSPPLIPGRPHRLKD
jgi:hypothetical protein